MAKSYDFSGWATKNNLRCSDGRTIIKDAFKGNDGQVVPLVWNHQHNDVDNVLGHALLKNKDEGVYVYGTFNETPSGVRAKAMVEHGDVTALSIYANGLQQEGGNVIHGAIREVSLVLAGANPGALIDSVIRHGEESDEEAVIFTGEPVNTLSHADSEKEEKPEEEKEGKSDKEIIDSMTEEQRGVMEKYVGMALKEKPQSDDKEEEKKEMKHNVFDQDSQQKENVLTHADIEQIFADAKRFGSLKDSVLAHAEVFDSTGFGSLGYTRNSDGTTTPAYGIGNVDYLFPDARTVNNTPEFIKRETTWVQKVMGGVHHTPFSRIKSIFADITEDEARAKGYIKGKLKKEEVFGLLKRTTTPTTIYKKQKMDRDDIVDIVDFNVVAWLKSEMRMMLDEEIARAILIGDGRSSSSDDKINEMNVRPIWTDSDLFTVKVPVEITSTTTDNDKAKKFIRACIKARKNYKGSGKPTLFTTEDMLTDMLLIEDTTGRTIYESEEKLATALRVKEIVTVEDMEGLTRTADSDTFELGGIIVNLNDYNVGADKGGEVNMFDDFDIDYNQQKYLIETRCSGALIKPFSAMAIEFTEAAA